ncbi:MAG: hypothetical protein LUG95_02240 [Clostridiales bacterium]|nr:hypothetical protein [Clostridiales bacterium]
MNNKIKKSIKTAIEYTAIAAITLAAGLVTAAISFNLFDNLTQNQMRMLFALDIICLVAGGRIFFFLDERRTKRKKAYNKQRKMQNKKIAKSRVSAKNDENIFSSTHYAA